MSAEFRTVDIWVGKFASKAALSEYVERRHANDDDIDCRFASDQGMDDLDDDFLESSFHRPTSNFKSLAKGHSFCESYYSEADAAFRRLGVRSANSIILLFGGETETPQSLETTTHSLTYLGRFSCESSPSSLGDSGSPQSIYLIVDERELFYDELQRNVIPVDQRGLCIGRRSDDVHMPLLDISNEVPETADVQVKIYRDQFDQWILEDVAGNGLTVMDGVPMLIERTFPWQGRRLAIGRIQFTWSIRPTL